MHVCPASNLPFLQIKYRNEDAQDSGERSAYVFIYVFLRKSSEDSRHKPFDELSDCSVLGSVVFFFLNHVKKKNNKKKQ